MHFKFAVIGEDSFWESIRYSNASRGKNLFHLNLPLICGIRKGMSLFCNIDRGMAGTSCERLPWYNLGTLSLKLTIEQREACNVSSVGKGLYSGKYFVPDEDTLCRYKMNVFF